MNTIAKFRKCTLSNDELLRRVDEGTDNLYKTREIPGRHIPARPDRDYDLLVGELVLRFQELEAENKRLREERRWIPVTERLPEDEGLYVVLCPTYVKDPIVARWNNEGWFDNELDFHEDITDHVTHWIAIPQPPKEQ